jgi:hypothetical protein
VGGSQFDRLTRGLATGASRRSVLKGLLGLGGVAVSVDRAEAARRPTPTPKPPSCPGQQHWEDGACVCPDGSDKCGPACCPTGQAECCDNACCYGECYGEELCCPTGSTVCDGVCLDSDQCCSDADCTALDDPGICQIGRCVGGVCLEGYTCFGQEAPRCCGDNTCADMSVDGNCCHDGECPSGICNRETHVCVPVPA